MTDLYNTYDNSPGNTYGHQNHDIELIYEGLNDMQLEAVQHDNGPLLILAGAGSGKTRVITHRIAHLIAVKNVEPWNIIAVTFTNKAAKEMRERVNNIVGYGADNIWISTFHSMCVRILRRFIDSLGYNRNFSIYDTDDQRVVMKEIIKQFNYDTKTINDRKALSYISSQKNELIPPEEATDDAGSDYLLSRYAKLYTAYQDRLKTSNALDFDDLIMKTVELFTEDSEALDYYRRRFRYILVDEYQDTNTAQFRLLSLMSGADDPDSEHNLCVVGDDDQSIYKFRGANIYNILNFEKSFPETTVIRLEQNYRSTSNILEAANNVIANNSRRKEKKLWCDKDNGSPIKYIRYNSDFEEADGIASAIRSSINNGGSYREHAVLYRTNAQSRAIEEAFINMNIPYKIVGGINFYSRKEIKDILAYLKTIDNGADDVATKRIINVPKRGIGLTTIGKISEFAADHGISFYSALKESEYINGIGRASGRLNSFVGLIEHYRALLTVERYGLVQLINTILEETGYLAELRLEGTDEAKARIENIEEFINKAASFEETVDTIDIIDTDPSDITARTNSDNDNNTSNASVLSEFLENVALVADIDSVDEDTDVVLLMTLHSAKGLEFPNVYICGMEENLFPSSMALYSDDPSDIEEERRLCYVGITRAMNNLTLSSASRRRKNGEMQFNAPSRFIREIPRFLITESAGSGYSDHILKTDNGSISSYSSSSLTGNTDMTNRNNTDYKPYGSDNRKKNNLFADNPYITKASTLNGSKAAAPDYKTGDTVRHIKFGKGTVRSIEKKDDDYYISVEFENFGMRKMKSSFAKLTKI